MPILIIYVLPHDVMDKDFLQMMMHYNSVLVNKGCVPLGWSGSGLVIRDYLDRGRSNEPMNPLWTRIHRFIWSPMIQMISDHWSWSRSYQRNAPKKKHFQVVIMVNLTLGPYERNILWSRQQLCVQHCYHPNQEEISFLHTLHVIH